MGVESELVAGSHTLGSFGGARRRALVAVALAGALSAGCGRSQSNAGAGGSGAVSPTTGGTGTGGTGTGGTGTGGTGTGGTGTGGQAGTIGEAGGAGTPEACTPSARAVPMRQLTRFQYDNVLRDVLGDDSGRAQRLPNDDHDADLMVDGPPTSAWVADLHGLAHDFAVTSTSSGAALSATLGCDLEGDGEAGCEARLFESILPRLLRRPLDAEDLDEFEALLATGAELGGDFASGVRMVLEVALQSPELLYRVESGEPLDLPPPDPRSGWSRPTPFEMASRLSFLLWGSAPDETLLAEAAAGGLRTKEEVRATALRLLDDERATVLIRSIHLRLLRLLDRTLLEGRDPAYTEQILRLMQDETAAFLDDVSSSGAGGFALLLTAPYTYLNEELAAFYGIPDVTGPELRKVPLASPPYSGILTQGSFLTAQSITTRTSPTQRGMVVLEAFLCDDVPGPPPPSHVAVLPPEPPAGSTTRELLEAATLSAPECAGCHRLIDPAGFALDHFDPIGRYRATEAGAAIDTQAAIAIGDQSQLVDGAPGLGRLLADSPNAHRCYVRRWATYAYATTMESPLDDCSRAQLADAFQRTSGDLRALLLELTQTDAFLYMAPEEL
jgi:hypothetical protein